LGRVINTLAGSLLLHARRVDAGAGGLIGDLPAYGGLGEGGLGGYLACSRACHVGEGGLDVVAEGPDGNLLHGVAVGHGGFLEAIVDGDRGEAADAGDFTMAIAEARGEAGAGGRDGVAADMDTVFDGPVEEMGVDERVHLFHRRGIGGLEGEAGVREEAVEVVEEVIIDGLGEVGWGGRGFAGVAAGAKDEGGKGENNHGCECG